MKISSVLSASIAFLTLTAAHSIACDLCGCANVTHPWAPRAGIFSGATEQFTHFGTLQSDGHEIGNDARQRLDSSITQIFLGYNVTPSFGVQVNVPFIHRSFRRTTETGIDSSSVSGLGDMSVLATYVPIFRDTQDFTFLAKLSAGVKLPTGDPDRLHEEAADGHHHEEAEAQPEEEPHHDEAGELEAHAEEHEHAEEPEQPEFPESGVHGHDLALGTGSVDPVLALSIYTRWQRGYFAGDVQYAIRTRGEIGYRYANDLLWSGGPGFYLVDNDDWKLGVQCVCSGETKGKDRFRGQRAEDTAITSVFLGPKIAASWKERLNAEVGIDLPVSIDNSALQIVPDYRIRASVSWQF